ncbi:MAG: HAD-IIIA family hydrolase [Bacteroidia bacterium]|nr:HAD-IIIA family hydrolase [Bacteroidia bacterium]
MRATATLFLDRDGVLNKELDKDYVKTWNEFDFEPFVCEALQILSGYFDRMIIVTNQRGVGAGLMSQEALEDIHARMLAEFKSRGVIIDRIYAATDEDRASMKRKPNPFMGLEAQKDFPEIDFKRSLMAGNSASDMEFGKSLQMLTLFIDDKKKYRSAEELEGCDYEADSLFDFATQLQNQTIQLW